MSAIEQAPASASRETQISGVSGAAHAGQDDVMPIEKVELAATRAADGLRRALATDEKTREQFLAVLHHLSALHAQLGEWQELHHRLHELLAAFSPFYASLRALRPTEAGPTNGRALLWGWRPCQTEVDQLIDLENGLEHIRLPHPHQGRSTSRPDWGARIGSLRREVEDRLREEGWNVEGLIDLADEFGHACDCYLSLAGRESRRLVEKVQRLHAHLLGGLL